MITRSIGKVLRGKATPLQLAMACILGSMLGFLPGYADGGVFLHAPGLLVTLFFAVLILNANLPLAALSAMIAKLVSLAVMPVTFEVGRFLLDGPTQPLFQTAINAPVLALFGFEYYATTGGLALGLVFGLIMAVFSIRLVRSFRARMSKLEAGSEAYKKYAKKWWVKVLTFVLIGGNKGKRTYAELNQKMIGNPIRPLGVVGVILIIGLGLIINALARDEIVTATLRRSLEMANGATVDVDNAKLDMRGGTLVITGLAMADPAALDTDIFRAGRLEADVSGRDMLRKRITLDRVVATDTYTGETRKIRGVLTRRPPPPPPAPEPGQKGLDDYLEDAKRWKERLAQIKDWLDHVDKQGDPDAGPGAKRETLRERLAREVREKGYTRVAATHLVEGAPTVLIREMLVEGLRSKPLAGRTEPEMLDVRAENISTQPWLVAESTRISVRARSENLLLDAVLNSLSGAGGESTIALAYRGMPAEHLSRQLKVKEPQALQGGTIDFSSSGTLARGGRIHLPLNVTIRDTTVSVPRLGSAPVAELVLPLGVGGYLNNPRILWDQAAFADALGKAGASELSGRVRAEAQKQIDKVTGELTAKVDEKVGELKGQATEKVTSLIGDRIPGGDGEKPAESVEEVKEKVEEKVTEEIKRALPGLLNPRR